MEIIKTHIVYKKQIISGIFIKVIETFDGKYFREMGSGDGASAWYEQISTQAFFDMVSQYNNKVQ